MIYLDNAATSYPKPAVVRAELYRALTKYPGNPGRGGHRLSLAAAETVFQTRSAVKDLIHADSEEQIIFTQNATFAINTILQARVRPGIHLLISNLEHNSVYRPVYRLAQRGVISYSVFSPRGDVVANLNKVVRGNTRILLATHVSNVTGEVLPVAEIADFCLRHQIYFILDASQSIGHREVDVRNISCDALCAPGHKGLFGLQGSGILYIRQGDGLRDVFQGGSGSDSLSAEMPDYLPERLEPGTLATPSIGTLGAGVRWVMEQGVEEIERHEEAFTERMFSLLSELPRVEIFSPPTGSITAFRIPGIPSDAVANYLDRNDICVRGGYHCSSLAHHTLGTQDTGLVRISAGAFNNLRQADEVARCVRSFLSEAPASDKPGE